MVKKKDLSEQIANLPFLEELYQEYLKNPSLLDPSWKTFFDGNEEILESIHPKKDNPLTDLAEAYRLYGHLAARINSLAENPTFPSVLTPFEGNVESAKFKKIYCETIGFEFKGIDSKIEAWIQQRIESPIFSAPFSNEEKKQILSALMRAELLESFLHTKHVGKKRFSLEGGETLIPMLEFLNSEAAENGITEIVMGMSHRGRLNVLANILGKSLQQIFKEFDENLEPAPDERMGDVKYHKGFVNPSLKTLKGKSIALTLASNPSHLESVDAVVEGESKAKQVIEGSIEAQEKICPLLIHGDAAVSGQGVVYETMQLSQLNGYNTGGTLHIVVNNQVGFTTSPEEGRSTRYCTDIAHAFECPVFHVNGDDPENAVRVMLLALEIRQKFHIDVFIDLNCYRKYGHNEGDEPSFTQPADYRLIRSKRSILKAYQEVIVRDKIISEEELLVMEQTLKEKMQQLYADPAFIPLKSKREENNHWKPMVTGVEREVLLEVSRQMNKVPSGFELHPKLQSLFKEREKAVEDGQRLDWGLAECLAYGTLLWEGFSVRISGQDCGRGTFSHRHAAVKDQNNSSVYYPLAHLRDGQGRFDVLNSCLSEVAVLGFEYGYSLIETAGLTIWEAQFGDFANSAQVIIDQYISSGEEKWGQVSGIVLLLPHGFEGQGPEHSSARLERFLALTGHDNMIVANPTTPAQLFHLLRSQVKRPFKKPLVVMTPKGLLRYPSCTSCLDEFIQGHFLTVLNDPKMPKKVKRVVFCSGRIYYDLDAYREKMGRDDLAFIRLEQLYPLDEEKIRLIIKEYEGVGSYVWVQEEPQNMGGWSYASAALSPLLPKEHFLGYIGRERSATPATGFYARHKQEHDNILTQVFDK